MDETREEREKRVPLPQSMIQTWKHAKLMTLILTGQYEFRHPLSYDPLQSNILATECLSKYPNLLTCVEALERGADPNVIAADGLVRPLHLVAKKSNVFLVECLVAAGADINAQNGRNQTPLILASDSTITDSSYLAVIRYLAHRRDSRINLRDVGGNTALLNGIYRSNVWITRELLLAGAALTIGEGSPCEISQFIFSRSIFADQIPDRIMFPWKYSVVSKLSSLRGRYDLSLFVLLQLCYNSDISLVYRMVLHRRMEMEEQGISLKAFHPYGTRSPEQLELEAQQQRDAEDAKNRQRQLQREDRQTKKKLTKKQLREARELERWQGVVKGIEAKVDHDYGYHNFSAAHQPTQTWMALNEESSDSRGEELSPGKRWKVVEVKRNGVYSTNPFPGSGQMSHLASQSGETKR